MSGIGSTKELSDSVENLDAAAVPGSDTADCRVSGFKGSSYEPLDSKVVLAGPGIMMTTWQKRDWRQFYDLARRPWRRHRPPRPVYPSGLNRIAPAQGYSLSELDDAGVDLDLAEQLGLPVDAGRIGVYGPNVTVLREFIRSNRHPL
jgi:ribosomal protein L13E